MKHFHLRFFFLCLLSLVGAKASAHDIEVKNADGVTIYYNWTNNNTELQVTFYGNYSSYSNEYSGNVVIPESVIYNNETYSVTSIGREAFEDCSGLTSVTIGNSVTSIGSRAFEGCSGLTSVTIPNSVTSIGYSAFWGCSGLASITIPNSVTSIGSRAFYGCSGLTSVHVNDLAAWCVISFESCDANPLSYAHHLFLNGEEITDLIIPTNVTSIGQEAFSGCSGLTSVTIPNSVTSIGEEAFRYCSGLTSVTIPNSVTSIGDDAFWGCSGLTSVTIPNSVSNIGSMPFWECPLNSINVENGNTKYDSRNNCNAIIETASNTLICGCSTTVIPNSVTSIASGAFAGCPGLTSFTIPNGITRINMLTFADCSDLTSITIPNSVTYIDQHAFLNCTITDVFCYAEKAPSTHDDVGWMTEYTTLHVPASSIESYKSQEPWSYFKEIVALPLKCAMPTISYVDSKLSFSCETEDVTYTYNITSDNVKGGNADEVQLIGGFKVTVYASKEGYEDSDVATLEIPLNAGGMKGDLNVDGSVNALDIQEVINIAADE